MLATMSTTIVICSFDLLKARQGWIWDAKEDLQEVINLDNHECDDVPSGKKGDPLSENK